MMTRLRALAAHTPRTRPAMSTRDAEDAVLDFSHRAVTLVGRLLVVLLLVGIGGSVVVWELTTWVACRDRSQMRIADALEVPADDDTPATFTDDDIPF